ncbi:unnamed protein product [Sympodiomycopsis kandeliae]
MTSPGGNRLTRNREGTRLFVGDSVQCKVVGLLQCEVPVIRNRALRAVYYYINHNKHILISSLSDSYRKLNSSSRIIMSQDKFYGWLAPDTTYKLEWGSYTPKTFTDDDVELDITHCGICWSDLSTMSDSWGKAQRPLVVGHEIVGLVTRVGKNVTHLKEGQRAGVGAQCDSCKKCHNCEKDLETYCTKGVVGTYNGQFVDGTGSTFGGYATRWRGNARFTVPIPDGLESHIAAPLMCGGVTIYSPLKDYGCGTEGVKRVGIVGIGGIGAFGVAFAKALGADEVVAIGHTPSKRDLALELGATDYVALGDGDKNPLKEKYNKKLDLIVVTANNHDQHYDWYVQALRPRGHVVNIAIPHEPAMPIPIGALIGSGANIGGSLVGPPKQIKEMLEFAAKTKPKFLIENRKLSDANQAVQDMAAGKPRFRYCMENDLKGKEESLANKL